MMPIEIATTELVLFDATQIADKIIYVLNHSIISPRQFLART